MPVFADYTSYGSTGFSSLPYTSLFLLGRTSGLTGGFSNYKNYNNYSNYGAAATSARRYPALLPKILESMPSPTLGRRSAPRTNISSYTSSPRTPVYTAPKPVRVDTDKIDVSTPRKPRRQTNEVEENEKEGVQRATIKRGRTVVRIHTKHVKENPNVRRNKMTPGERLKEKFMIRDNDAEKRKRDEEERRAIEQEREEAERRFRRLMCIDEPIPVPEPPKPLVQSQALDNSDNTPKNSESEDSSTETECGSSDSDSGNDARNYHRSTRKKRRKKTISRRNSVISRPDSNGIDSRRGSVILKSESRRNSLASIIDEDSEVPIPTSPTPPLRQKKQKQAEALNSLDVTASINLSEKSFNNALKKNEEKMKPHLRGVSKKRGTIKRNSVSKKDKKIEKLIPVPIVTTSIDNDVSSPCTPRLVVEDIIVEEQTIVMLSTPPRGRKFPFDVKTEEPNLTPKGKSAVGVEAKKIQAKKSDEPNKKIDLTKQAKVAPAKLQEKSPPKSPLLKLEDKALPLKSSPEEKISSPDDKKSTLLKPRTDDKSSPPKSPLLKSPPDEKLALSKAPLIKSLLEEKNSALIKSLPENKKPPQEEKNTALKSTLDTKKAEINEKKLPAVKPIVEDKKFNVEIKNTTPKIPIKSPPEEKKCEDKNTTPKIPMKSPPEERKSDDKKLLSKSPFTKPFLEDKKITPEEKTSALTSPLEDKKTQLDDKSVHEKPPPDGKNMTLEAKITDPKLTLTKPLVDEKKSGDGNNSSSKLPLTKTPPGDKNLVLNDKKVTSEKEKSPMTKPPPNEKKSPPPVIEEKSTPLPTALLKNKVLISPNKQEEKSPLSDKKSAPLVTEDKTTPSPTTLLKNKIPATPNKQEEKSPLSDKKSAPLVTEDKTTPSPTTLLKNKIPATPNKQEEKSPLNDKKPPPIVTAEKTTPSPTTLLKNKLQPPDKKEEKVLPNNKQPPPLVSEEKLSSPPSALLKYKEKFTPDKQEEKSPPKSPLKKSAPVEIFGMPSPTLPKKTVDTLISKVTPETSTTPKDITSKLLTEVQTSNCTTPALKCVQTTTSKSSPAPEDKKIPIKNIIPQKEEAKPAQNNVNKKESSPAKQTNVTNTTPQPKPAVPKSAPKKEEQKLDKDVPQLKKQKKSEPEESTVILNDGDKKNETEDSILDFWADKADSYDPIYCLKGVKLFTEPPKVEEEEEEEVPATPVADLQGKSTNAALNKTDEAKIAPETHLKNLTNKSTSSMAQLKEKSPPKVNTQSKEASPIVSSLIKNAIQIKESTPPPPPKVDIKSIEATPSKPTTQLKEKSPPKNDSKQRESTPLKVLAQPKEVTPTRVDNKPRESTPSQVIIPIKDTTPPKIDEKMYKELTPKRDTENDCPIKIETKLKEKTPPKIDSQKVEPVPMKVGALWKEKTPPKVENKQRETTPSKLANQGKETTPLKIETTPACSKEIAENIKETSTLNKKDVSPEVNEPKTALPAIRALNKIEKAGSEPPAQLANKDCKLNVPPKSGSPPLGSKLRDERVPKDANECTKNEIKSPPEIVESEKTLISLAKESIKTSVEVPETPTEITKDKNVNANLYKKEDSPKPIVNKEKSTSEVKATESPNKNEKILSKQKIDIAPSTSQVKENAEVKDVPVKKGNTLSDDTTAPIADPEEIKVSSKISFWAQKVENDQSNKKPEPKVNKLKIGNQFCVQEIKKIQIPNKLLNIKKDEPKKFMNKQEIKNAVPANNQIINEPNVQSKKEEIKSAESTNRTAVDETNTNATKQEIKSVEPPNRTAEEPAVPQIKKPESRIQMNLKKFDPKTAPIAQPKNIKRDIPPPSQANKLASKLSRQPAKKSSKQCSKELHRTQTITARNIVRLERQTVRHVVVKPDRVSTVRHQVLKSGPQPMKAELDSGSSSDSDSDDDEDSEEDSDTDTETEDDVKCKGLVDRTSTSSEDSGFGSTHTSPLTNKECNVNCHRKCERHMPNLCGVNQKLLAEALSSLKKGPSSEARAAAAVDGSSPHPARRLSTSLSSDSESGEEGASRRFTPPARTIPRFRKYTVDDYQFLKVLGKGSFGKVLLAELRGTECYYAVKCLKKDVVLEDDDVECTLIERKVLALGTRHPYLCHLFCTFQTESHLFFVMEYLNGGDLMFHIQQSNRFEQPRACFYAAEIVSGLKFLHKKGIVYRDLKLDNILLDYEGHVRIADFGMCKLQIYLDRTADTFCGTPDYMAPEIIRGLRYNQCVDWWSFGVLLYEMLIGQSPFNGCDEDELFWSICNEQPYYPRFLSKEAQSILAALLEKDSARRLGTPDCPSGDVYDQPFFKSIDWGALDRKELEPPFKPRVQHALDVQYFDSAFTQEAPKLTPVDKEILQSMDQSQFHGFSYTNPNACNE